MTSIRNRLMVAKMRRSSGQRSSNARHVDDKTASKRHRLGRHRIKIRFAPYLHSFGGDSKAPCQADETSHLVGERGAMDKLHRGLDEKRAHGSWAFPGLQSFAPGFDLRPAEHSRTAQCCRLSGGRAPWFLRTIPPGPGERRQCDRGAPPLSIQGRQVAVVSVARLRAFDRGCLALGLSRSRYDSPSTRRS